MGQFVCKANYQEILNTDLQKFKKLNKIRVENYFLSLNNPENKLKSLKSLQILNNLANLTI